MQDSTERLLTGEEIAKILNVSLSQAYALIRRGEITSVRMGRSVRVRPEDLKSFIESRLNQPPTQFNF